MGETEKREVPSSHAPRSFTSPSIGEILGFFSVGFFLISFSCGRSLFNYLTHPGTPGVGQFLILTLHQLGVGSAGLAAEPWLVSYLMSALAERFLLISLHSPIPRTLDATL